MAEFRGATLIDSDIAVLRDVEAILPEALQHIPAGTPYTADFKRGVAAPTNCFWIGSARGGPRVVGLSLHTVASSPQFSRKGPLPDSLSRLDALEELFLMCDLDQVPSWVTDLSSLRALGLSNNRISTLPLDIDSLAELRYLDVSMCSFWQGRLPQALGKLAKLETLNLKNDGLASLPAFSGLISLETLHLDHNHLLAVPENLRKVPHLEVLSLSWNSLTALPTWLGQLPLKDLSVDCNQLATLPEEIGSLKKLVRLAAGFNKLEILPASIGAVRSLTHLYLGNNHLRSLPDEIGDLAQLRVLNLEHNNLSRLPDTLGRFDQLVTLDVSSNPLTELPAALANSAGSLERLFTNLRPGQVPPALAPIVERTQEEEQEASDAWHAAND